MGTATVYAAMCADILHGGHANIISRARKLGRLVVGLLTDSAMSEYKGLPYLEYARRRRAIAMLGGIEAIVPQHSLDYTENLLLLKPSYVVHGDDWKQGVQRATRDRVIDVLSGWGGMVLDLPYTEGVSSTSLRDETSREEVRRFFRIDGREDFDRVVAWAGLLSTHDSLRDGRPVSGKPGSRPGTPAEDARCARGFGAIPSHRSGLRNPGDLTRRLGAIYGNYARQILDDSRGGPRRGMSEEGRFSEGARLARNGRHSPGEPADDSLWIT